MSPLETPKGNPLPEETTWKEEESEVPRPGIWATLRDLTPTQKQGSKEILSGKLNNKKGNPYPVRPGSHNSLTSLLCREPSEQGPGIPIPLE